MNPDNTQKLTASDSEKLSLILTGVQSLAVRFDNVDARFNHIDSRLEKIDSRLVHVEQAVTELRDGQQRLQENVLQLQEGQRQLHEGQERLTNDVSALTGYVKEQFLILSGATNAEIRDLNRRVTRLELNIDPPRRQT